MPLARFEISIGQRREVEKMGMHEAGCYVVARKLGFEVGEIRIRLADIFDNFDCSVAVDTARRLTSLSELDDFLVKRTQVLLSGAIAQSLVEGKTDPDAANAAMRTGQGREDRHRAEELVHLLGNIRCRDIADDVLFREAVRSLYDELWEKTRTLVEVEHEAISALGKHLASRVEVGGETYVFRKEGLEPFLVQD